MPPVQNSIDLQFANLVAAKIQSCYTILREMDAGAPTLPFAGGGDHSETTETRPDGETRTLTDIAPGFEVYDRLAASRGIDVGDLTEEIVADHGARIEKAHAKAEELNARLGLDLTWRDILTWPMPEGVQVSVQQRGTPGSKSRSRPASKPAPAKEPNRDSEGDDDN